jgi:hypothetical protein
MTESESPKFFRCQDHVALGKLVKTWATGKDHLELNDANGQPLSWPVPETFEEFERQLHLAQAGPLDLDEFKRVHFCRAPDDETLVIPLPSPGQFARGEAFRRAKGSWMPPYFDEAYDGPRSEALSQATLSQEEIQKFQDIFATQRIGEYCISHCC